MSTKLDLDERDALELPTYRPIIDEDYLFDNSQQMSDMATAQLLSEADAITNSDEVEPNVSASFEVVVKPAMCAAPANRSRQLVLTKTATVPTEPPTIHPKFKLRPLPSRLPAGPRTTSPATASIPRANTRQFIAPPKHYPTSTQAFLEENIEDFMSTPSQEMREMYDDIDDDELPSNTQIAKELCPTTTKTLPNSQLIKEEESYDDLICTQDFILSSQDMREISTMKTEAFEKKATNDIPPQPTFREEIFDESIFDDFPSTQDLALTPEDIKEIGPAKPKPIEKSTRKQVAAKPSVKRGKKAIVTPSLQGLDEFPSTQELIPPVENLNELKPPPSRGPLRTINNLKQEMSLLLGEVQKPKKRAATKAARASKDQSMELAQIGNKLTDQKPVKKQKEAPKPKISTNARKKQRFFEEKDADLEQSPAHEIKSAVQRKASLPPSRTQNTTNAEAQALEAAIKESRLMAQRRASSVSNDRRKYPQQTEAEILDAAIQESRAMALKNPPNAPPPPAAVRTQQNKRFFQEKETDLFEAAIQASKNTAQRKPPSALPPTAGQQGKRFFQEKESDMVQAAIQESKMMASQKAPVYQSTKMALKDSNANITSGKRKFQRVQSMVSDYGDDDLTEQDLLGLC